MWFRNHVRLVVGCMWYGNVVGLVVGFGWIDNVVGLVVGRMMMKLVDVGRSNTLGHTQLCYCNQSIPIHIISS